MKICELKPVSSRSGCKVCWYVYATREQAELAAGVAVIQAELKAAKGYDFGYQVPGTITKIDEHKYEVCFP